MVVEAAQWLQKRDQRGVALISGGGDSPNLDCRGFY